MSGHLVVVANSRFLLSFHVVLPFIFMSHATRCTSLAQPSKKWFVDKVHFLNATLRPIAELLTELQRSEGGESCEEGADTSIQETGATHVSNYTSNKETCANTLSIPLERASLFTKKNHSYERKKMEGYSSPFFR